MRAAEFVMRPPESAFMATKPTFFSGAQAHELLIFLTGQIAERELQHIVKAGFHGLARQRQAVVRDGDEADLSLPLGLLHRLIETRAVSRLGQNGGLWN